MVLSNKFDTDFFSRFSENVSFSINILKLFLILFSCDICHTSYRSTGNYNSHNYKTHRNFDSSKAQFKCEICNGMFVNESALETHKLEIHEIDDFRTFKCLLCSEGDNKARRLYGIHRHVMLIHNKESFNDCSGFSIKFCCTFFDNSGCGEK